ncbi:unnamed protein product [Gadus morhua 'NCC']
MVDQRDSRPTEGDAEVRAEGKAPGSRFLGEIVSGPRGPWSGAGRPGGRGQGAVVRGPWSGVRGQGPVVRGPWSGGQPARGPVPQRAEDTSIRRRLTRHTSRYAREIHFKLIDLG